MNIYLLQGDKKPKGFYSLKELLKSIGVDPAGAKGLKERLPIKLGSLEISLIEVDTTA